MSSSRLDRRDFITSVGVGSVASAVATTAVAQAPAPTDVVQAKAADAAAGYTFLKPSEASFVEALADHMCPQDELTASGTQIGVPTFIDRALAGGWGKGDRFYSQGPWKAGTPNQGYQLPLTPAELYRAGIQGCDAYCRKTFQKTFASCTAAEKETFLKDLAGGKINFDNGLSGRTFFDVAYQSVIEGMYADPIYGGNKDKTCWKMIGFPGVVANHAEDIKTYGDGRRYTADPLSLSDIS